MSFSSDLKTELSKINNLKNKQEVYCEFLGYLSTINTSIQERQVKFSTENQYNINRFAKLLNNLEITNYKIEIIGKTYSITFKQNEKTNSIENNINQALGKENLKKAYIRGSFLGAGSINNPQNKYHLEIIYNSIKYAQNSLQILQSLNINAKILDKTIYLKDGEEISKFLALIGASASVLKFEEIRVLREMKNNVNRLVNCETANMNKIINTSVQQIENIKQLKKRGQFNKMPEELKQIATLREKNPNATLEELGRMLPKPIGKSSVSNRFKRISQWVQNGK